MSASKAILEVEHLSLSVAGRALLRDVSLRLHPGESWCVMGPNGAGKSLFLHTLVGLRPVERGSITLSGKRLEQWTLAGAARVRSFLPQTTHHAFPMRVLDAVVMGRYPYLSRWQWEQDEDRRRARQALRALELEDIAQRDIRTLSGGERQRVCIAALLAQDAPMLILDEPVTHLDLRHQTLVLDRLRDLARNGRGVMLSLHDLNLAQRFASHAMLFLGRARALIGPIDAVMREAVLSDAFGCTVRRIMDGDRPLFVTA